MPMLARPLMTSLISLFALAVETRPTWPDALSTPFHKYDPVCCVDFRFWRGATREHPQPWGRHFLLAASQTPGDNATFHPCDYCLIIQNAGSEQEADSGREQRWVWPLP